MSIIVDSELYERFVSEDMHAHFRKKFPEVAVSVLRRRIIEFLKFIAIAGSDSLTGELPVSLEIDKIWHEWILETRKYESLCTQVAGRFIHHSSIDASNQIEPDPTLEQEIFFIAAYVFNFGSFDNEGLGFWPAAKHVMRRYGLTLDQLNDFARDIAATCAHPSQLRVRIQEPHPVEG